MKPEQSSSTTRFSDTPSLQRWLYLLSGAGLLSSSVALLAVPAWANPEGEQAVPTSVESVPSVPSIETSAESLLRPQVITEPTVEAVPPDPQPSPTETESRPQVTSSPTVESSPSEPQSSSNATDSTKAPNSIEASEGFDSVFIDPTDYSLGATRAPESPSLIFSDRSTGCQFTLNKGQSAPNQVCSAGTEASQETNDAGSTGNGQTAGNTGGFSVGPVAVSGSGLTVGGTTVISREYFNEKLRPLNLLRRGAEEFVFPLSIPASITSLFGWRVHPIFGDQRFHAGTDLGAPEGTPVLATKDGEVIAADYMGGYGLTVILRHEEGTQETRYAHLSQILVRPGETVEQGDVVGLVGSTGNSTGPHLHFELRELTAQGWILIDPNELMDYTVANLVEAINNPLQALGLAKDDDKQPSDEELANLPYRPAQPNAN